MHQSAGRKSRILLIEDNNADVELLELALQNAQLDYDLTVLERGGDALAFIDEQNAAGGEVPDLAIVDMNLPQHDGLEILKAIRSGARFANVPVAVFSSSSLPGERASLEALRIARFITKPADLDELLRIGMGLKQMLTEGCSPDQLPL